MEQVAEKSEQGQAYPAGSIKDMADLVAHMGQPIWSASRRFCSKPSKAGVLRGHGVTYYESWQYHYYTCEKQRMSESHSLADCHIPWQDYNDWFLFTSKEAAQAYLDGAK